MLPIQKAITDIKMRIPELVLNLAFLNKINKTSIIRPTVDEQIENIVIRPKVLVDLNVVGGMTTTIKLDMCQQEIIPFNETSNLLVIYVPPELTGKRRIIMPLSLTYGYYSNGLYTNTLTANSGLKMVERAFDAIDSNVGGFSTTNLELIGPNTILVYENIFHAVGGYLRVKVENDENLRNLNSRYLLEFSKLCRLATQGYIHNSLIIDINRGFIYGGHELNKVQEIIEKYEDSWEQYEEYLSETWKKLSFMSDDVAYSRLIRASINPVL